MAAFLWHGFLCSINEVRALLNLWAGYSTHYWTEPAEGVHNALYCLHQSCLLYVLLNIKQSNDLFLIYYDCLIKADLVTL